MLLLVIQVGTRRCSVPCTLGLRTAHINPTRERGSPATPLDRAVGMIAAAAEVDAAHA